MPAPVLEEVCTDADLQVRVGAAVLAKACDNIAERDAARASALVTIINAFAERTPPITSADFAAMSSAAQRSRLCDPVKARTCELIFDWAFTDGEDMWGDRAKKMREEWQALVAGQITDSDTGGGTTPDEPIVRTPMYSVQIGRR